MDWPRLLAYITVESPTIVTWHFYDLPTIRPSGFVNSAG